MAPVPVMTRAEQESTELRETKAFVQAMVADFSICPFTNSADRAGVPRGDIRWVGNCDLQCGNSANRYVLTLRFAM
jgi:hypothetical protein